MQKTDSTELIEKLVAHFLAYSFLGKVFFETPAVELLNTLKKDALFADWPLESANPSMHEGLTILRRYTGEWDEADFPELKRDYARLFIGPNRLLAPPWESVYRSEEHLLFEEETMQVRAMYRKYGFAIPSDYVQPDDHFGLEMSFVAHLCNQGIHALNNQQWQTLEDIQQSVSVFFEEHICQWADAFLTDVKTNAATPYYQGLVVLASGCIAHTVASWQPSCEAASES